MKTLHRDASAAAAALGLALILASCGGSGGSGSATNNPPPPPAPAPPPLDLTTTGMAVVKVRDGPDGATILEEKLTALSETGPQRRLSLLDAVGSVRARYAA